MKFKIVFLIVFSLIIFIMLVYAASYIPISDDHVAIRYLEKLGWSFDRYPLEIVDVLIPTEFDKVYENYNELQKEAGFDLQKYKGEKVTRYTFNVKNFNEEEDVRANILIYKGKVIGGDLMTTDISGFMIPLKHR